VEQGAGTARSLLFREADTDNWCSFSGPELLCMQAGVAFDEYHLFAVDYDGTTSTLYLDGLPQESKDLTLTTHNGAWLIGSQRNNAFLRGDIAELFVFDRNIHPGEIPVVENTMGEKWDIEINHP
jgi:hypothetical protein